MEDDHYDEFGNYIGPDLDPVAPDDDQSQPEDIEERIIAQVREEDKEMAVVLHEDKNYYPDAEEVFGRDVQTLVEDEDH